MSQPDPSAFAALLRTFRLRAGVSQEYVANRARIGLDTVSALERGKRRYPTTATVSRLADALALTPDDRHQLAAAAKRPPLPRRRGGAAVPAFATDVLRTDFTADATRFIGRTAEIAAVSDLLASCRIVTLVGSGGVGKTRIAREVARAMAPAFQHGVRLVQLATLQDPHLIVERIGHATGLRSTNEDIAIEALAAHLEARHVLLVIDNCEHLIDAVGRAADTLSRACERLRVLVTSRERLHVPSEWVYRVPSMQLNDAMQLFTERARAARHSFFLDGPSNPFVADICRRLDGIPLAIELAAGRAGALGLTNIAKMLDERFRLLTGGHQTSLPRHQTMRASLEWSFALLTRDEQTLFERSACFAGSWSADAAEAVCRFGSLAAVDVIATLSSLVDKSMIAMELDANDRARYRLLESNRAFALEMPAAGDERSVLRVRLAQWVADFADRARAALHDTPRAAWIPSMVGELENARAALDWALGDAADVAVATRIVMAYRSYWADSGLLAEGLRWLSRLGELLAHAPDAASEAALWQARSVLTTGQHTVDAAREAIVRLERLDDPENLASATMRLAIGYRQMAAFADADAAIDRALALYRQTDLGTSLLYASALSWKASALIGLGKPDEARRAFEEAIALDEALGDDDRAAVERLNLAELEFAADDVRGALAHTEAVIVALGGHHDTAVVVAHLNVAAYRIVLGEYGEARVAARKSLEVARHVGHRLWRGVAIQHLATLIALNGDVRRAACLAGYADACYAAEGSAREPTEARTFAMLDQILRGGLSDDDRAMLATAGSALTDDDAADMALLLGRTRVL